MKNLILLTIVCSSCIFKLSSQSTNCELKLNIIDTISSGYYVANVCLKNNNSDIVVEVLEIENIFALSKSPYWNLTIKNNNCEFITFYQYIASKYQLQPHSTKNVKLRKGETMSFEFLLNMQDLYPLSTNNTCYDSDKYKLQMKVLLVVPKGFIVYSNILHLNQLFTYKRLQK